MSASLQQFVCRLALFPSSSAQVVFDLQARRPENMGSAVVKQPVRHLLKIVNVVSNLKGGL